MAEPVLPPAGDPTRQATDAIGGFVYQAWQAVDAWLRLGSDDVLFLEHAEDFDVATAEAVTSTQVKGEVGELSLGRAQARDAIAQYWELRERNPDRAVSYRYLTTRTRGYERGEPFGGRRGLDVWDGARRSDEDLRALRAFLIDQALPEAVLDVLKTGTDDEVRTLLVHPIHWDTSAAGSREVERLVEERVIAYGDARALPVPPSASRNAVSAMFRRVVSVSADGAPRRLTRVDFAVLFEDATTEPVPAGSPAAAAARAARTPSRPAQAGDPGFLELVDRTRLPVVVAREDAVATVRRRAQDLPLSSVVGSTGAGKTTLAELAAAEDGGWYRLDLRGLQADGVARRLDEAALALAALPDSATVLVDDYAAGDSDRVATAMGRLLTAAAQQAIHVVVTTPADLPSRVAMLSPRAGEGVGFTVPMLDEGELAELAEGYGCPPALAPVWARVLAVRTSGHPQLAAAFAANAWARRWPEPEIEDVVGEPTPIARVRTEAQATLRGALRDAEAFDLVRRLSVFTLPFTRGHALRLAAAPPPLGMASLDLDALVGPWIEAVPGGRYRVSPLLSGLYRDSLVEEARTDLHAAAADAVAQEALSGRTLDAYDLSALLSHGMLGQNVPALVLAAGALKESDEFSRVADYVDWFGMVGTGGAQQVLVTSAPVVSLLLRELQFRVALVTGRDLDAVVDAWEAEILAVGAQGEPVLGLQGMLAASILTLEGAMVSAEHLVDAARGILALPPVADLDVEATFLEGPGEGELDAGALLRGVEATGRSLAGLGASPAFVFTVLGQRPATAEGVAEFIEAAVTAPAPVGPAARETFRSDVSVTESVASKPWLRASDAGTTDWSGVLAGLDALAEVAGRHELTALAVSVERARAVVLHEEVGDRAAAEAALDVAAERLGGPPRLREYRGKILRMEGELAEALAFYEDLFPTWEEADPNTSRLYAFHDAVTAAGGVGAWDRAAYWAGEGETEAARLGDDSYVRLCYAVDRAFAEFKAGRPCDAITRLRAVVAEIPEPTDARLRMLHRRTTHVTAWLVGEVGGLRTAGLSEPAPGMASRFEPDPDTEDALPILVGGLAAVLGEAADLAGCVSPEPDAPPEGRGTFLERSMEIRRRLNEGIRTAAPDLPDRYVETIEASERAIAERTGHPYVPSAPDRVGTLAALTYGAIAAIAAEPVQSDVLGTWLERLRTMFGTTDDIEAWAAQAETAFVAAGGSSEELVKLTLVVRDGDAHSDHRMMSAAALAKASRDPQVRGQSLALLASSASVHPFGMGVGAALAALSGRDVPPGRGVQEAARAVLENDNFGDFRLDPRMVDVLRTVVDNGPTWGVGSRS